MNSSEQRRRYKARATWLELGLEQSEHLFTELGTVYQPRQRHAFSYLV